MSDSCIFCRIARGEIPSSRVAENEDVVAFRDVNPQAPIHVLVAPKAHVTGISALPGADRMWNQLMEMAQEVASAEQLTGGFRLVVNQGADGGQTINHLHMHVLAGRAMRWPPG